MARYIDADDVAQRIMYYMSHVPERCGEHYAYKAALKEIVGRPTADVEEVKHGEWLNHEEMFYDGEFHSEYPVKGYKCSECGRVMWDKESYCNCGAKMDGGKAE